jgi:hypothetical protein
MRAAGIHRHDGRRRVVEIEGKTMKEDFANFNLLVKPPDAARMLDVSPRKLWAMTFEETPGLPYVRCGRLVRYSPDDLRRWIDVQRKEGSDDAVA